ncbi:MAG: hypothetical protein NZ699_04210 [Roseiflexus sp.]|nr:hypothetical protein [Roseiflexus sp.]MDW8148931.1 hypothetical protein [Roseiflexaceae bacterium]
MLPLALADDPAAALRELRERDPKTFARLETEARQAGEASGGRGSGPPVPAIFTSWLATAQQAEWQFQQTGDWGALDTAVEA